MKFFKKFFVFGSFLVIVNFFAKETNEQRMLNEIFLVAEKNEDFSADDIKILEKIARKDCTIFGGPNQERILQIVSKVIMQYNEFNSKNVALMKMIDKKIYNSILKKYLFLIFGAYSFLFVSAVVVGILGNENKKEELA